MPPSADPADTEITLTTTMRQLLEAADAGEQVRNALADLFPKIFAGLMEDGTVTSIGANCYLFYQLQTIRKLVQNAKPDADLFMIGLMGVSLSTGTFAQLVAENERIEGKLGPEPDGVRLILEKKRTPKTPTPQEITGAARFIQLSEDQDDDDDK